MVVDVALSVIVILGRKEFMGRGMLEVKCLVIICSTESRIFDKDFGLNSIIN